MTQFKKMKKEIEEFKSDKKDDGREKQDLRNENDGLK